MIALYKNSVIYMLILVCFFLLTGCGRYWEKTFTDFPNTQWESKEPYLVINIDKYGRCTAKLDYNGETLDLIIRTRDEVILCYESENEGDTNIFFSGYTDYSNNKFILEIRAKKDGILDGKNKIVLLKK